MDRLSCHIGTRKRLQSHRATALLVPEIDQEKLVRGIPRNLSPFGPSLGRRCCLSIARSERASMVGKLYVARPDARRGEVRHAAQSLMHEAVGSATVEASFYRFRARTFSVTGVRLMAGLILGERFIGSAGQAVQAVVRSPLTCG